MPGGENLGDHSAHRRSDDVGAFDAEVVEDRGSVVGHVLQGVHRGTGPPQQGAQHRRIGRAADTLAVELAGQARVAVVVPDDTQPAIHQLLAETVAPHQQLRTQAHDQQDGGVVGIAHLLVVDVQVAGLGDTTSDVH